MSNEYHDVVLHEAEACDLGVDAHHALAPDERLADVPFSEWGPSFALRATEGALRAADVDAAAAAEPGEGNEGGGPRSVGRDALLMAITAQCFEGRPDLEEAGLRFCAMAWRAGMVVPLNANERRQLRCVSLSCNGSLWLPRCDEAAGVFELLKGGETKPWRIGRRLSLMAYAFNRGVIIRRVFPSMESIGTLWGLSADNKRSAICAALVKLRQEILRSGWLREHRKMESFQFWFEKSAEAKAVYAEVQMGNENRRGGEEAEAAEAESATSVVREVMHGIPVKPEFRGLSPAELKRRLDALWRGSE